MASGGWRVDHKPGRHDDHVVAVALAAQAVAGRSAPVDLETGAFTVPLNSAVDLGLAPHPLPREQRHYDTPKPYSHPLLDPPESGSVTDSWDSPFR
jgi:hypothetical protein